MCPSGPARQPRPGNTCGLLEARITEQGVGRGAGSFGLTYLLPRLAQSALWSWRALQEAKHEEGSGCWGGLFPEKGLLLPWEIEGAPGVTAYTPLPSVQGGKLGGVAGQWPGVLGRKQRTPASLWGWKPSQPSGTLEGLGESGARPDSTSLSLILASSVSLSLMAHSTFSAPTLGACQPQGGWPGELSGACPAASRGHPAVPKGPVTEEAASLDS